MRISRRYCDNYSQHMSIKLMRIPSSCRYCVMIAVKLLTIMLPFLGGIFLGRLCVGFCQVSYMIMLFYECISIYHIYPSKYPILFYHLYYNIHLSRLYHIHIHYIYYRFYLQMWTSMPTVYLIMILLVLYYHHPQRQVVH